MMTFSESARQHLIEVLRKNQSNYILLQVNGKGCNGFSYEWTIVDEADPLDFKVPLIDDKEYCALIDNASLLYLAGATVDYVSTLSESYLKVSNPNAKSQCGCGTSFSV